MVETSTERPVPRDLRELEVAYACVRPPPDLPATLLEDRAIAADLRTRDTPLARCPVGVRGVRPGVGQSLVTLGLALAWASTGRRVLVLDLDPAEDLARLLHVGWALRPGNAHTIANVVRTRATLTPAPSLLADITIASLGTMPGGHPSEVARGFARTSAASERGLRRAFAEHDRVLVDLPEAAALAALGGIVDRWLSLDIAPGGGRVLGEGGRTYALAALPAVPDHWSLIDGSVGEAGDLAFRELAHAIDAGVIV